MCLDLISKVPFNAKVSSGNILLKQVLQTWAQTLFSLDPFTAFVQILHISRG